MSGVIVPTLFPHHGHCRADLSNEPSLCIMLSKLTLAGVKPSRYCTACLMAGLPLGNGCEHISPSVSTRRASPAS
ncbi:hypothetical protein C2845_PM05G13170 [Panicum miliaceum]|uniref:Uncharacterized protein n=1 Tax=Panicum miliaceum TaxID=4540 RepID=A0A3L6ST46_PANMI|nr:hypothetical protein C2845_PM05G13170 [Panicum miliaceum]